MGVDNGDYVGHSAWVPKPVLKPGEREIETYRASRSQGSRAVGGHLLLTNQRVLFYPHKLDALTGGKSWECDLASISHVRVAEQDYKPFDGSMRRRLQIECADTAEHFVVNKVETVVGAIGVAVGS
jgi:hypothetical protein